MREVAEGPEGADRAAGEGQAGSALKGGREASGAPASGAPASGPAAGGATEGGAGRPTQAGIAPRPPVVALDGPAGSGKSTVARKLADALGASHLDTGAMYRALALKLIEAGADASREAALPDLLENTAISLPGGRVILDGRDVTDLIRSPTVSITASQVAQHRAVRLWMVARQREMAASAGGAVMEGRDIGTVVLPDADLKIFLTAAQSERARRRSAQEGGTNRRAINEIAERDRRDTTRAHSPLMAAPDAVIVDTTDLTIDEVVEKIRRLIKERV
ncbi:MAG: (d)CMP kinase [Actinomycetota bacterium]